MPYLGWNVSTCSLVYLRQEGLGRNICCKLEILRKYKWLGNSYVTCEMYVSIRTKCGAA